MTLLDATLPISLDNTCKSFHTFSPLKNPITNIENRGKIMYYENKVNCIFVAYSCKIKNKKKEKQ